MFLTLVTFVKGVTSQTVVLPAAGEEILGYVLGTQKGDGWVFSWKQEEQKWIKNDIGCTRYLMQRMTMIWTFAVFCYGTKHIDKEKENRSDRIGT